MKNGYTRMFINNLYSNPELLGGAKMQYPYSLRCFLDGIQTDTRIYEIIAELSLYIDYLTIEECEKASKYNFLFYVSYFANERKIRLKKDPNALYETIDAENKIRIENGKKPIQINKEKIVYSIF